MATNNIFRVRWRYSIGGNILEQFPTQSVDIIATVLTGGDGTQTPDPNSVATAISNYFPTPSGATIVIVGIGPAQTPVAFN